MALRKFLVERTTFFLLSFSILVVLNFMIPRLLPGNPVDRFINPIFTPQIQAQILASFGLDKPLHVQFYLYVVGIFTGNYGVSFLYYPTPVTTIIIQRIPWTFFLVGSATLISTLIGIFVGLRAAWRIDSRLDSAVVFISMALRSIPTFWLSLLLLITFAVTLRIFPTSGYFQTSFLTSGANPGQFVTDLLAHSVLPVAALSAYLVGGNVLIMRASTVTTLSEDFVLTLNALGYTNRRILYKHVLRNAFLPMITNIGIQMGFIVSGAVLVETVFSYPGMGLLIFQAVLARDYPTLQGSFFVLTVSVLIAVFITEFVYSLLDPRIRR